MKFRDPKTGEVFENIANAVKKFCEGRRCVEDNCPFRGTCNWDTTPSIEAARLMGYEVVEEQLPDATKLMGNDDCLEASAGKLVDFDQFKERGAEKMDKPLGEWTLTEAQKYCAARHGNCSDDCRLSRKGEGIVCKVVLKPRDWDLSVQPHFTDMEMVVLRTLYDAGARWVARGDKHLRWYVKRPFQRESDGKWDMCGDWGTMSGRLPDSLFPSILHGQRVELKDILP